MTRNFFFLTQKINQIIVLVLFFTFVFNTKVFGQDGNLPVEKSTVEMTVDNGNSNNKGNNNDGSSNIGSQYRLQRPHLNIPNNQTVMSSNPDILKRQAQQALNQSENDTAKLYLHKLADVNPTDEYAYNELAKIDAKENNPVGALKNIMIVKNINPSSIEADLGIKAYEEYIKQNINPLYHIYDCYPMPHDPRELLNQGVRFYSIGDVKDAYDLFNYVAKVYPYSVDAWYNLGVLDVITGQFNEARNDFYKVQELAQNPATARMPINILAISTDRLNILRALAFINQNEGDVSFNKDPLVKVGNSVEPRIFVGRINIG